MKVKIAILILLLTVSTVEATTFHGDVQRTGNFEGCAKTPEVLWKTYLSGLVDASPIYWDGKVYATNWYGWGNWNPGLYCINATILEFVKREDIKK